MAIEALFGRWCQQRQTFKTLWAFYSDGSECKECRKARVKKWMMARTPEQLREINRRNWENLKADPLAYAAYKEKQAKRRKSDEAKKYQRDYQRNRRAKLKNEING